jgi:hypothetical protein
LNQSGYTKQNTSAPAIGCRSTATSGRAVKPAGRGYFVFQPGIEIFAIEIAQHRAVSKASTLA